MNKGEFLSELRKGLSGLPEADIEERVEFYSEMIDDRMEEGMSEREAVEGIGTIEYVTSQIISETPITKIVKERVKSKRKLAAWEIVLLILGFPVWFPLLMSAFAVFFSIYIVGWSVIASFWSAEIAIAVSGIGGLFASLFGFITGSKIAALALLGMSVAAIGLALIGFLCCLLITKGILVLTKKIVLGIKNLFIGKGEA